MTRDIYTDTHSHLVKIPCALHGLLLLPKNSSSTALQVQTRTEASTSMAVVYKVITVGSPSVGKSSICIHAINNKNIEENEVTVGATFFVLALEVDGVPVKFEIWDTGGQERFQSLVPLYYRNAHAAIVVYNVTDKSTFDKVDYWVQKLRKYDNTNTVIALVGNKADLKSEQVVSTREGRKYAESNGLIFLETSAKTGINVKNVFIAISRDIKNKSPVPSPDKVLQKTTSQQTSCCH
uniref:uncharacterized protein isoform X1 n=2 Tax=Myxine glutinosa TaxID=7769 RepID=UPI00358ECB91